MTKIMLAKQLELKGARTPRKAPRAAGFNEGAKQVSRLSR